MRFHFLYREGNTYHWESDQKVGPRDSRVEHVIADVSWYWSKDYCSLCGGPCLREALWKMVNAKLDEAFQRYLLRLDR